MENKTPPIDWTLNLARQAGAKTLQYFRKNFRTDEKSDRKGLVTEADLASEALIKTEILKNFPNHNILAEESGWEAPERDGVLWLIDPLDGTNNFARGNAFYCVSIAWGFQKGGAFEVQQGVVFHPPTGDLFWAERGKGAFWNQSPMRVSGDFEFRRGSYSTGIGSLQGDELRRLVEQIFRVQQACESTSVRINGAAALDLAHVACGISQGFWEAKLNPWDTAAGSLLVQEGGGEVLNFAGLPYNPLRDPDCVAGSATVVRQLRSQL